MKHIKLNIKLLFGDATINNIYVVLITACLTKFLSILIPTLTRDVCKTLCPLVFFVTDALYI